MGLYSPGLCNVLIWGDTGVTAGPVQGAGSILVVDDDEKLRQLLVRYLSGHGYEVTAIRDGRDLEQQLLATGANLVVLDLMLPGEDGFALAAKLRRLNHHVPIIILSARGSVEDRLSGLEAGVDDYLPKPFSPRELLARIRSVLRGSGSAVQHERIQFGPYVLDLHGQQLLRDGTVVALTHSELTLLTVLAQRPERVMNRDYLVQHIKGYERSHDDRSIDIRITRLRRKIEANPQAPVYIRTVRGAGYLFSPNGTQS